MNRERGFRGGNSYESDLFLDISRIIESSSREEFTWLDVACGTGRALIEAKRMFPDINIQAIDLVDFRDPDFENSAIGFFEGSVSDFETKIRFDLITCVHGFHYFGDKLGILSKLVGLLDEKGVFLANFDQTSIRSSTNRSLSDECVNYLTRSKVHFDTGTRVVKCIGPRCIRFPYSYLGSDDSVGPNYTGQNAVNSFYLRENDDER